MLPQNSQASKSFPYSDTWTNQQPLIGTRLSIHDLGIWICSPPSFPRGFPDCSVVKNLPTGDTRDVGSIPGSWRSPEEEMATHSSILAWKIPWQKEHGRLQSMGLQRVRHNWATKHILFSKVTWTNDATELWLIKSSVVQEQKPWGT